MINLIIKKAGALDAERRNKLEKQLAELALGSLSHRVRSKKEQAEKSAPSGRAREMNPHTARSDFIVLSLRRDAFSAA